MHFAAMLQPYLRRGYNIHVHYEENKRWLWEAVGIPWTELDETEYHAFPYHPGFNSPGTIDGCGSKLASNLISPLPDIGRWEDIWDEICEQDMSYVCEAAVSQEAQDKIDRFVEHCPRPLILLHSHGTNMPDAKNILDHDVLRLYDLFLTNTEGTLICLDWNNRIPYQTDGRMRHTLHHWGHLSLEETMALYNRAALLIGVDSGPYHLSYFSKLPALGVFHHHYPACVTLPRTRSAVMTRCSPDYQAANRPRRRRWSILEYPGVYPSADEIFKHAMRMLAPMRYMDNERMRGRDMFLQQAVREWTRGSTPMHARAYRDHTLDYLLRKLQTFPAPGPVIVETGCQRTLEDWSAGGSTTLFAATLDGLGRGSLDSIDIAPDRIQVAQQCLYSQQWHRHVRFQQSDSVMYLKTRQEPIDVLYLDALDVEEHGHSEHCLGELEAATPKLHERSIVVIDDCVFDGAWNGKGRLVVPWALANGWRIASAGYQVVLERKS